MGKRGNGEGSIYFSERLNRWVAQYSANGKRKSVYGKTRKDVKDKLLKAQSDIFNNTYVDKTKITLEQILKNYIDYKYTTNKIKARTYNRNLDTLSQIKRSSYKIAEMQIQSITVNDIKEFLKTITKYSNNSISKIYGMLCKGFKIAVSEKYIVYNPAESELISKPKSEKLDKKVEALTIKQQKKLISILDTKNTYDLIILIQLFTGMRVGEVLALEKGDIDLKKKTITISRTLTRDESDKTILGTSGKTQNSTRTITMNDAILKLLKLALKNMGINPFNLIFFDYKDNSFITPIEINCYLRRLNKTYKICDNLHTHILRHTYATRCIEAGMSAKVLQTKLGHKKITTTLDTYASVFNDFQEAEDEKYNDYMLQNKISI